MGQPGCAMAANTGDKRLNVTQHYFFDSYCFCLFMNAFQVLCTEGVELDVKWSHFDGEELSDVWYIRVGDV